MGQSGGQHFHHQRVHQQHPPPSIHQSGSRTAERLLGGGGGGGGKKMGGSSRPPSPPLRDTSIVDDQLHQQQQKPTRVRKNGSRDEVSKGFVAFYMAKKVKIINKSFSDNGRCQFLRKTRPATASNSHRFFGHLKYFKIA